MANTPGELNYNASYDLFLSSADYIEITRIALVRLGVATHGFDQDTRCVSLEFKTYPDAIKFATPAHGGYAPPGCYMLFALKPADRTGILYPSVAKIVRLKLG